MAKNLKQLIFSCNPVEQEEKQGLPGFLLLFFRLLCIRRTPSPAVRRKLVQGGRGKAGQSTKKEPIPQTKTHTPKRHNRLHQDKTKNCNAHYSIKKRCVQFGNQTIKHYLCHRNNKSKELC